MCIVINLDVVCLICLQHDKQMHSIFTPDVENHDELQIAQKICILSELKLDEDNESLPDKICNKCLEDLKVAWRFHKNCQAAKTIFQTIIGGGDKTPPPVKLAEKSLSGKDLVEQKIKISRDSQIKRIENDSTEDGKAGLSKSGDKPKEKESVLNRKSQAVEYDLTAAEDNSISCEGVMNQELTKDDENEEFQTLTDIGEEEELVDSDDDLVEYYVTDDGVQEEQMHNIEKVVAAALNKKFEKSKNENRNSSKILKNSKIDLIIVDHSKDTLQKSRTRGRSRQQEPQEQLELPESSKQHQQTLRPKIVKQNIQYNPKLCQQKQRLASNSALKSRHSEDSSSTEVREVRTRKRKSSSPDTKPPKICDICGNSYRFQHALNAHMRRHFNDKPFPCEVCEKAFVSNVELRRHMRVHTGDKPYACQYCDRRFSDFGSRIKHERTHTGERPYMCTTCGKTFAYPHVLSVHLRIHTGEKKFRCEHCTRGFTKKAYLQSHLEQQHKSLNNFQVGLDDTRENSQMVPMKSEDFEECIFTTEIINDQDNDIPVVGEEYEEDAGEEDYDDVDQDCNDHKIILQQTLMQPKLENDDTIQNNEDDDGDIHEIVEIHPDEYTIRVR